MRLTPEAIDDMFSYHKPKDTGVTAQHEAVRAAIRSTAHRLVDVCGSVSGELVLAIRALQAAMFYANAHIAINQSNAERPLDQKESETTPTIEEESSTSRTALSPDDNHILTGIGNISSGSSEPKTSRADDEEKQNATGGSGSENQTTSLAS